MKISVGVIGKVLNSQHSEHKVCIVDDSINTGGFLVFENWKGSDGPNRGGWFDTWVEDETTLICFFAEAGWSIEWSQQQVDWTEGQ